MPHAKAQGSMRQKRWAWKKGEHARQGGVWEMPLQKSSIIIAFCYLYFWDILPSVKWYVETHRWVSLPAGYCHAIPSAHLRVRRHANRFCHLCFPMRRSSSYFLARIRPLSSSVHFGSHGTNRRRLAKPSNSSSEWIVFSFSSTVGIGWHHRYRKIGNLKVFPIFPIFSDAMSKI